MVRGKERESQRVWGKKGIKVRKGDRERQRKRSKDVQHTPKKREKNIGRNMR